ncbi:MAG: DUF4976 domain-containing protein [Gemmataceae bacterium]|nr:DUF4976 domain-containing protein [Gemmataceae bacterium]
MLATAFLALCAFSSLHAQPNIVLVMTDDQGYGDLSCHGNPVLKTKNIDRLYAQSLRFTDFHVSPTCSPTRSALMTGRHEFKNGVTHTIFERERLSLKAITLAQVLKDAGYNTGIFGKWHLGDEEPYRPYRRGFTETFIHGAGGIGQTFPGSCGDAPRNSYFNPAILHNGKFVKTQGYCTDVFFSQAINWIGQASQARKPFFAYITPNAPHAPLDCPESYFKKYQGRVPDNSAKFFGMVENIDDNIGRLMEFLDKNHLEENTLFIFMTDNGGTNGVQVFNAGMRGQKATPYMGGTRVPAFWRWPAKWQGGRDIKGLTAHIDIFPTLVEITGAKAPAEVGRRLDGRSLLPLLTNPQAPWAERILFTHLGRWEKGLAKEAKYAVVSARNTRYNLVNASRMGEKWELFDIASDPGEKEDIAAKEPAVVKELKNAIDQWWDALQPELVNEDAPLAKGNPFKDLYWKQFGGGPDAEMLKQMDPTRLQKGGKKKN